jgi:GT2 family glycosyltransferase
VIVASSGRPEALSAIGRHLAAQTLPPYRVVYSVVSGRDLPPQATMTARTCVVLGPLGLPGQRNRGMALALADSDIIAFFDDDYLPSRHALDGIARFFAANPGYVGVNGHLIADGINSPGIGYAEAAAMVDAYDRSRPPAEPVARMELRGLYGCNMAFRAAAIRDVRFDERLALYGWQEDIDFAARLLPRGRLGKTDAFAGVHCGSKTGRSSGVRLGYSQVANPLYLMRKGTMPRSYMLWLVARNLFANHWRALRQEPWIDRRGRVRGNWLALRDLLAGRADPERILQL